MVVVGPPLPLIELYLRQLFSSLGYLQHLALFPPHHPCDRNAREGLDRVVVPQYTVIIVLSIPWFLKRWRTGSFGARLVMCLDVCLVPWLLVAVGVF